MVVQHGCELGELRSVLDEVAALADRADSGRQGLPARDARRVQDRDGDSSRRGKPRKPSMQRPRRNAPTTVGRCVLADDTLYGRPRAMKASRHELWSQTPDRTTLRACSAAHDQHLGAPNSTKETAQNSRPTIVHMDSTTVATWAPRRTDPIGICQRCAVRRFVADRHDDQGATLLREAGDSIKTCMSTDWTRALGRRRGRHVETLEGRRALKPEIRAWSSRTKVPTRRSFPEPRRHATQGDLPHNPAQVPRRA